MILNPGMITGCVTTQGGPVHYVVDDLNTYGIFNSLMICSRVTLGNISRFISSQGTVLTGSTNPWYNI